MHLSAAKFYGTMLLCCAMSHSKLDVPWGHTEVKKNFTSPGIRKFFTVLCQLLLAKHKNNTNCTIEKTTIIIAKLKKLWSHVS